MNLARRVLRSLTFYPVTTIWLVSVGLLACVAGGALSFGVALVVVSLLALNVLLTATYRQASLVHSLVNSQRDEMVAKIDRMDVRHDRMSDTVTRMSGRIGQLLDALTEANVPIPSADGGVRDDR